MSDVDAGSASEQVTLGVLDGAIRINTTTGLTIVGNNSASLTMTGTIANLNGGLNGMTYTPTANFNNSRGSEVLSVGINDLGDPAPAARRRLPRLCPSRSQRSTIHPSPRHRASPLRRT